MTNENQKHFQKIFEFVVKNRGETLTWSNAEIKNFIRWALYYRKLFIVWAPAGEGKGQRIAALGIAWRAEKVRPQADELTFENTEFGVNLFAFQVVVHPDFRNVGTLFQLLSLCVWRYPGINNVFWNSQHHNTGKLVTIPLTRLLRLLSGQVSYKKIRKVIRRPSWAVEEVLPQFPTLKFLH